MLEGFDNTKNALEDILPKKGSVYPPISRLPVWEVITESLTTVEISGVSVSTATTLV
jgi:hypothetical protein